MSENKNVLEKLTFAGDYVAALRDFALAKGIDSQALIADSGLSLEQLLQPPARLHYSKMHTLVNNVSKQLDNFVLGAIEFGHFMATSSHGSLGIAIRGCQNMREICELASLFLRTRTEVRSVDSRQTEAFLELTIEDLIANTETRVDHFFQLSLIANIDLILQGLIPSLQSQRLLLAELSLPSIAVAAAGIEPEALAQEFKLLELQLDCQVMCIKVPTQYLDLELNGQNSELAQIATRQCQSELASLTNHDLAQKVRHKLRQELSRNLSLQQMAEQLFMSASTLQRRLKEQALTYQDIKTQVRQQQANYLLSQTHKSIDEIALELGFSDTSNFSKSFKSWAGQTPHSYRQQHQQPLA